MSHQISGFDPHPLSDLSDVLSVLPAGEHVGEGERLQAGVDQIRLLRLLLVLLCEEISNSQVCFRYFYNKNPSCCLMANK